MKAVIFDLFYFIIFVQVFMFLLIHLCRDFFYLTSRSMLAHKQQQTHANSNKNSFKM